MNIKPRDPYTLRWCAAQLRGSAKFNAKAFNAWELTEAIKAERRHARHFATEARYCEKKASK